MSNDPAQAINVSAAPEMPELTRPTKRETLKAASLTKLVGWVLGAMSLLNLVQDIGRFAVLGKLKVWLDAYAFFVKAVGRFLFGWLHFRWISISAEEHHVLVLAAIFCAAVFRAEFVHERPRAKFTAEAIGAASGGSLFYFLFALIPAALLPGYWGLGVSVLGILLPIYIALTNSSDARMASGEAVRRELIAVLSVFFVLVALNYSVFRTDGG